MNLFKKNKSKAYKQCFKCKKIIKGSGYSKAFGRYCCEKCCSRKDKPKEMCEFC